MDFAFKDIRSYLNWNRFLACSGGIPLLIVLSASPARSEDRDVPVDESPTYSQSEAPLDQEDVQDWVEHQRPSWGFELSGSGRALGGQNISSYQAGVPARSVSFEMEYEPEFFQSLHLGVLSFGPSFAVYPLARNIADASTRLPGTNFLSLWGVGGQVRYQAYFSPHQLLIPMAAYSVEMLNYDFSAATSSTGSAVSGPSGKLPVQGPTVGLWLLLNDLSEQAATELYDNTGFLRSYLVAEFQELRGADPNINVSGSSFYFGVRLER